MKKNTQIGSIRSDGGGEFFNELLKEFCYQEGIWHQLLALRTPKQNGIVEIRNRSLVEMGRTLLNDHHKIWAEARNTHCYICNRCLVRPIIGDMAYEIYYDRISNISHLRFSLQDAIS